MADEQVPGFLSQGGEEESRRRPAGRPKGAKDKRKRRRGTPLSLERAKRVFLEAYARTGVITAASLAANVNRRMYYSWIEHDEAFSRDCVTAREECIESVEEELRRRAVEQDPAKKDTQALIFWLKANHPTKYGDRQRIQFVGNDELIRQVAELIAENVKDADSYKLLREGLARLQAAG